MQLVNNDSNHYKFTGKERDGETGLDYFGARYYSNGLGRWVSADWSSTPVPVPYANFGDPQSLNLYAYVCNIPTTRLDNDGHCFWDVCVVETAVVVTAIAATAAYLATPSGQRALKAAAKLIDKALDAAAEGGNALAAGCAGSGTCLTGMKPPGGPPEYYQSDSQSNGSGQGDANGQSNSQQSNTQSSGNLPKPPRGKGSVPKDQRDPKRTATDKEKAEMREDQKGNCAQCGEPLGDEKGEAHHTPDRHADGGSKMKLVHKECHNDLHSCN